MYKFYRLCLAPHCFVHFFLFVFHLLLFIIVDFSNRVAWVFINFSKGQNNRKEALWARVGLGGHLEVHLWTARVTSLLRQRTSPQLRRLSDFQGPTSARSSSTKSRVCTQELVCPGGVCKERSRRCILRPIRLIFGSANTPHHS